MLGRENNNLRHYMSSLFKMATDLEIFKCKIIFSIIHHLSNLILLLFIYFVESPTSVQAFFTFPCFTSELHKGPGQLAQLLFTLEV